jgi:DNA mismatch endonuclease (patch repair protein)
VDGCFWHGCPKHLRPPNDNHEFWNKKLDTNKKRDRLVNRGLRKKGWVVVRIWEHEFKEHDRIVKKIERSLTGRE